MKCSFDGDYSKLDRKVIYNVNTHGWHVTIVIPGETNPGWAYSVGLFHSFRHPEIVVFGLDGHLMYQLINHVGREARGGGRFEPEQEYGDILERYRCTFRVVDTSWYQHVLVYATWFYNGVEFPALQLIWPDRHQRYPWESQFEPRFHCAQPLLYHTSLEEARAGWLPALLNSGPPEPR